MHALHKHRNDYNFPVRLEDPELLLARRALTLQGAQQVLAILRGKKLTLSRISDSYEVISVKYMSNQLGQG